MADVEHPQQPRVEKADLEVNKIDQAMALCNKINDECFMAPPGNIKRTDISACAAVIPDHKPDFGNEISMCAAIIPDHKPDWRNEISMCAAIVPNGAGDIRDRVSGRDEPDQRYGARLDELTTGDSVVHAGGKMEISMPSGECLQVNGGKGWVLKDSNGKEIANNKTGNGQLPDGAEVEHVVPIMGKGWTTINYPNGDTITIDKNGVSVERDGKRAEVPLAPMAPTEKKVAEIS